MKIMARSDVDFHFDNGPGHPAVNVKVHGRFGDADAVMARFNCSETVAEKALEWCWESACEQFWEEAEEWVKDIFGHGAKVWQEGRSGGWAAVHGLADVEEWSGRDLLRWTRFARACAEEVRYLTSWEFIEELIDINEWAPVDPVSLQADAAAALASGRETC